MITDFERIPAAFVERYRAQFEIWAREFRVRGTRCAIQFERPPGAGVVLGPDGQPVVFGAWLEAEVDVGGLEPRVVIRPADDWAEELIARHVAQMRRWWAN